MCTRVCTRCASAHLCAVSTPVYDSQHAEFAPGVHVHSTQSLHPVRLFASVRLERVHTTSSAHFTRCARADLSVCVQSTRTGVFTVWVRSMLSLHQVWVCAAHRVCTWCTLQSGALPNKGAVTGATSRERSSTCGM
jgi:hypothetical protein